MKAESNDVFNGIFAHESPHVNLPNRQLQKTDMTF